MWGRRITSDTPEYQKTGDVLREVLSQLIEGGSESSWAHFEVIAKGGYFHNLLSGKQPWIEAAFAKEGFPARVKKGYLELNVGLGRSKIGLILPPVPDEWQSVPGGSWIVPLTDSEKLVCWIEECLAAAAGMADYRITGWTEGG
jgi:hypothetical protein